MADSDKAPIIIRKIVEDEHHAKHGGAWKVALADLMTAMMAFFLIMWLVASSSEDELTALADYFTPNQSRQEAAGGAGVLWGESPGVDGIQGEINERTPDDVSLSPVEIPIQVSGDSFSVNSGFDIAAPDVTAMHAEDFPQTYLEGSPSPDLARLIAEDTASESPGNQAPNQSRAGIETEADQGRDGFQTFVEQAERQDAISRIDPLRQREIERILMLQEEREAQMREIEETIRNAVLADEDRPDLLENIDFQITPEGLLIQIIDRDRKPVFETGSARLGDRARGIVIAVSRAIAPLSYPLVIAGHTDSTPYREGAEYTNWELSADRANSTRRFLVANGVTEDRFARIAGFADTEPLNLQDTRAPENRRIDILLSYPDPLIEANQGTSADR